MWTLIHRIRRGRRGAVAIEFALTSLPILYLFSGVTDLGIVYFREVGLSNAISAAAQYAEVTDQSTTSSTGTTTTATVSAANVETVLQNAAAQSMPGVTVTTNAACYSVGVSATSWTTSNPVTCNGSSCVTSSTTIKYVKITLSTVYSALLPLSFVGSPTLSQTTWVPLAC